MENSITERVRKLLSGEIPFDFHVTAGDPETNSSERIGVDKWMLVATSDVFRAMILDSELRHETEVCIPDVEPHIFKYFLVYCYSDILVPLSVDDGLKLLLLADKYRVLDLKDKLGNALGPHVNLGNLFMFLQNGHVCDTVPEIWEAVTDIIQNNTEDVFAHPDFVKAKASEVLFIIEQDKLSVEEICVWNATINWAKEEMKLASENLTGSLRQTMDPFLKYIRFCTFSYEEMCKNVASEKVLTYDEIGQICCSIASHECHITVDHLSKELQKRTPADRKILNIIQIPVCSCFPIHSFSDINKLHLCTKNSSIQLKSLVFFCTISHIKKIVIYNGKYTSSNILATFDGFENAAHQSKLEVKNKVIFLPSKTYLIDIHFLGTYFIDPVTDVNENENMKIEVLGNSPCKMSYLKALHYEVAV